MARPKSPEEVLARRHADAIKLLNSADRWVPFKGPTGRWLWRIPGSSKDPYVVNLEARSCTCPDSIRRTNRVPGACKHIRALALMTRIARACAIHQQIRSEEP